MSIFVILLSVYLCQALVQLLQNFERLYLISFNPNGIESCYPHSIDAETEAQKVQEALVQVDPAGDMSIGLRCWCLDSNPVF